MMANKYYFLLCLFSALICGVLNGQPAAREDAPALRFRVLGWDDTIRGLYFREGGEYKSFFAPSSRPSIEYQYRGPSPMMIYDRKPSGDPMEPPPVPIATVDLSPSMRDALLVFRMTPQGVRVRTFPDPAEQRVPGTIRFINLSGVNIAFMVNKETAVISHGQTRQVDGTSNEDNSITVKLASEVEGEWNAVYATVIHQQPESRLTIIVIPDPESEGKVSLRRMIEVISPPVEEVASRQR